MLCGEDKFRCSQQMATLAQMRFEYWLQIELEFQGLSNRHDPLQNNRFEKAWFEVVCEYMMLFSSTTILCNKKWNRVFGNSSHSTRFGNLFMALLRREISFDIILLF